MPRVSQKYIEAKRVAYFISNLWTTITLIESRDETIVFLKELLTPTEIRMLSKRIQIAKMLIEGYKYGDITHHVRVTSGTISTVNNQLQFGEGGYIKIIDRLIKLEQRKQKSMEKAFSKDKDILYPKPFGGTLDWAIGKTVKEIKKYSKKKSAK